jgi:hypothetical protein
MRLFYQAWAGEGQTKIDKNLVENPERFVVSYFRDARPNAKAGLMGRFALFLALASPAAAQPAQPGSASTAPVIVAIRIEPVNVFDLAIPGESWWLFRLANKIHVKTKKVVIRRELLLGPGERWDSLKALESERNLRLLGDFRSADVTPVARPDGHIDLLARTQDTWTLIPRVGFGTEGGQREFTYGIAEDNLLGYGKSVSASHSQNGDLTHDDYHYTDQRFLGTRYNLDPFYTHTQFGDGVGTDLVRPFFALDTPYGLGATWSHSLGEAILYQQANQFSRFLLKNETVSGSYGYRPKADAFAVQRIEAGWYEQKDQFFPLETYTAAGTLPGNRQLSGPTLGYSWIRPRYTKETYINKMERVEDFNMGNELQLFGGYAATALGSDRDRVFFNALDQQGFHIMPGRFVLAQVGAQGRIADGKPDNTLLFANFNLFWKAVWPVAQTWVGHLECNKGRNLDGENQITLGGNNGLRGYENYSFIGHESVLFNLEDRAFIPGEYWHLARFGGVAFFESGSVAQAGGITWNRFYSDLGVGLRVSPTRSQSGSVARCDIARALQTGPGPSRWVVSVTVNQAFQIFNSSTQSLRESPSSKLIVEPKN